MALAALFVAIAILWAVFWIRAECYETRRATPAWVGAIELLIVLPFLALMLLIYVPISAVRSMLTKSGETER